ASRRDAGEGQRAAVAFVPAELQQALDDAVPERWRIALAREARACANGLQHGFGEHAPSFEYLQGREPLHRREEPGDRGRVRGSRKRRPVSRDHGRARTRRFITSTCTVSPVWLSVVLRSLMIPCTSFLVAC